MSTKHVSKPVPTEEVMATVHAPGTLAPAAVSSIYLSEERLASWLYEKSSPEMGAFRCSYYLLIHMSERGPDEVTGVVVARELDDASRALRCDRAAGELASAAKPIASGYTRPQQFRIAAFLKAAPVNTKMGRDQEPEHKYIFLVPPDPQIAQALQDEASTAASIIGNLTRAVTSANSQLASNMQEMQTRMGEQNIAFMGHIERLLKEKWEETVKTQGLANEAALRDIQVQKSKYELEVMHKCEVAFIRYLAPVIGKVVEAKMGVSVEQGDHPLLQLAESLTPEQLLRFIDSMTDEQQAMFAQMAGVLVDRMPLEKKERFYQLIQENAAKKAAAEEAQKVRVTDQRSPPPPAESAPEKGGKK